MPYFDPTTPPAPPEASPQHFEAAQHNPVALPEPVQALEAIDVEGQTLLVPARPKVARDKPKAVRSKVNQEAEKDVSK